jgi:hypothetical protein
MTTQTTRIPPELRNLCARLATERTRPATWTLAADLRRQVLERLKRGEDAGVLTLELQAAIRREAAGAGRSVSAA